ncbi:aldo/keto reductase [Candidatus Gracilibacteria bacterium]|nr:aldo/keto reductase [Candidatus Gracilibacteria bacterium]
MQTKQLGNTGLDVTKICLGTMTWGYQNDEKDAHEQLNYAINECGINFIDTAELYAVPPMKEIQGLTEQYIGTWFAKNPGVRKKIILASKFVGPGIEWIRGGEGLNSLRMGEAIDASLERLQNDYIDLYQLHWPQRVVNKMGKMNYHESMFTSREEEEHHIISILQAFETERKAGKVGFLGLSNETPWGTMKFLELARREGLPEIQTVQNPYSLMQRQYEVGMAEISMYEGVGCLAYSPLAGGVLTGKYKHGILPEGSRYALWGKSRQPQNLNARSLKFVENMEKIARKMEISVTTLALAWVSDRTFVHSNIIGATTLEQLRENIASAEVVIPEEIRKEIDNVFAQSPNPATF